MKDFKLIVDGDEFTLCDVLKTAACMAAFLGLILLTSVL